MQCQAKYHAEQVSRKKAMEILDGPHGGPRARNGCFVWPDYDPAIVALSYSGRAAGRSDEGIILG